MRVKPRVTYTDVEDDETPELTDKSEAYEDKVKMMRMKTMTIPMRMKVNKKTVKKRKVKKAMMRKKMEMMKKVEMMKTLGVKCIKIGSKNLGSSKDVC